MELASRGGGLAADPPEERQARQDGGSAPRDPTLRFWPPGWIYPPAPLRTDSLGGLPATVEVTDAAPHGPTAPWWRARVRRQGVDSANPVLEWLR